MARPKEFDRDEALDAAIGVFREHGFEGTSTDMLVRAMKIGRQSLYDTFGDKWQLYCSAVERYDTVETQAHIETLRSQKQAIAGLRAMVDRVVAEAHHGCLGVNSTCEFGQTRPELSRIHLAADHRLTAAIVGHVSRAKTDGDISSEILPEDASRFLMAAFAGIRIAARGGADDHHLRTLGRLAIRALQ